MTVCEKVREMLLITGPAIILRRHRGVSEPIITDRMKTVRSKEASPGPAHCPHAHPPSLAGAPLQGRETQAKEVSYPSLGPEPSTPSLPPRFFSGFHPSSTHSFHTCLWSTYYMPSSIAVNKATTVPAQKSSAH